MRSALLAAVVAFALGALGGWGGRSVFDQPSLPEPRRRATPVREALEAFETLERGAGHGAGRGVPDAIRRAARAPLDAEDEAEVELLDALAHEDVRALLVVVRDRPGTAAAARAAWEATVRTPDGDLRRRREADFRRRHPAAWVFRGRTP